MDGIGVVNTADAMTTPGEFHPGTAGFYIARSKSSVKSHVLAFVETQLDYLLD